MSCMRVVRVPGDTRCPHRACPRGEEAQRRPTAQDTAVLRRECLQVCLT